MTLGEQIYNLRKKKGLSQEKLAEMTGVSRQTVHKWESDIVQPTVGNLASLAEALDIDQNELLWLLYPIHESVKVECEKDKKVEDETVATKCKSNSKYKIQRVYFCLVIVIGIILLLFIGVMIWFGFTADLKKSGDIVESNYYISSSTFFLALCITIVLLIVESFLIICLKINKRNKK